MKRVFVINFDESIIFNKNEDVDFYDEHYSDFEDAKRELVDYWETALINAKTKLKEAKNIKLYNVGTLA
jgi:hypothetical protein